MNVNVIKEKKKQYTAKMYTGNKIMTRKGIETRFGEYLFMLMAMKIAPNASYTEVAWNKAKKRNHKQGVCKHQNSNGAVALQNDR